MHKQAYSGCEKQSLRGEIHRHITRLLQDVKALEVYPHWVCGIGEPAHGEGLARQEMTEFVMNERMGDGQERQKGEAGSTCGESD